MIWNQKQDIFHSPLNPKLFFPPPCGKSHRHMALLLAIISLWNVFVFLSAFVLPCVREFRAGCSLDCALTFQLFHCPTQRPWQAAPLFFHCHFIYTHKHTLTPLFSAVSPCRHQETNRRLKNVSEKKKKRKILFVFFVCECDPLPLTSGYLGKVLEWSLSLR